MKQEVIMGSALEILRNIKNESIQLVLTDLPYAITKNKWDCAIDLQKLWAELLRIGVKNAIFAFTSSQPFTSKLVCSNIGMWKHEWVWIKNRGSNFANTVREPFKEHETIQIFSKGGWIYNKQMQERTGSGTDRVKYDFNQNTESTNYNKFSGKQNIKQGNLRVPSSWQKFNTEVGVHPTQKPVPLFEYLIKTYTNEGDLVLDCCAGSGTTGIACLKTNRQFILVEKEKEYYDITIKRIEDFKNGTKY